MIELDILKIFLYNKLKWARYSGYVDIDYLKANNNILYKLISTIGRYYSTYPNSDSCTTAELEALYYLLYPALRESEKEELKLTLRKLEERNPNEELVLQLLEQHRTRSKAAEIAVAALEVNEGRRTPEELKRLVEALEPSEGHISDDVEFVTSDLNEIYEEVYTSGGIEWRLDWLNKSIGPLRKGNFGFVFARPETGKTTFLADQGTYIAGQVDSPVLWFNNEQPGGEIMVRCYEAALGERIDQIFLDRERSIEEYREATGDRIKIIDDPKLHYREMERIVDRYKPALIIFDQIDKIQGFQSDRDDLQLGYIYQWARELAKAYAPVIGTCQADGTGEGVKWLDMGHVSRAKTSKQAEADWILGIGKSNEDGFANVRFFNLSKNKLLGSEKTIPSLRHGKVEVLIRPEIARYEELAR